MMVINEYYKVFACFGLVWFFKALAVLKLSLTGSLF